MANLNNIIKDIEQQYGLAVARAFDDAIRDITSTVKVSQVTAALRNGDVLRAIDLLNIDIAVFSRLQTELTAAYNAAAAATVANTSFRLPDGTRAVVRWDVGNPEASAYARDMSSQKVVELTNSVRDNAKSVIERGLAEGQGPNKIALDLVGRTGPNGIRTGGTIGLTEYQEGHVRSMRDRLASGDPSEMRKVLGMTRRDRRLDGIIRRAIADGRAPSAADIEKITTRYRQRLIGLRGETIARTEVQNAASRARYDATRVGLRKANVPDWAVTKKWRHGGGGMKPRGDHIAMAGTTVTGINTPFNMPDGARMMFPHDTSLGAGAKHVANCTCYYEINIDYAALFRAGY